MLTTFETLKKLKDCGYDEYCHTSMNVETHSISRSSWPERNSTLDKLFISCPTMENICYWLRSKGLHVSIEAENGFSTFRYMLYQLEREKKKEVWNYVDANGSLDHDTAISAGVSRALMVLKEKAI